MTGEIRSSAWSIVIFQTLYKSMLIAFAIFSMMPTLNKEMPQICGITITLSTKGETWKGNNVLPNIPLEQKPVFILKQRTDPVLGGKARISANA